MNYTNLNIIDSSHQFKYILERETSSDLRLSSVRYLVDDPNNVIEFMDRDDLIWEKNYWTEFKTDTEYNDSTIDSNVPVPHKTSRIILYFPRFSVDTYSKGVYYVLTIYTWILGKKIILKSTLLNRQDALAISTGPKIFLNDHYYEQFSTLIVDPYELLYGENWANWRETVVGDQRTNLRNDGGSNVGVSLSIVERADDCWIRNNHYEEAQSALLITDNVDDYLNCFIESNIDHSTSQPAVNCSIRFNNSYQQSSEGLTQYLKDTYGLEDDGDLISKFVLFVQDKENIYKCIEHSYNGIKNADQFLKSMIEYDSWNDYKDGLKISVLFQLVKNIDQEGVELLSMMSNYIFLDQKLFSYFIKGNHINHIKLSQVAMNNYNIDVVNKIEQNVVTMDRPGDYKSNIIRSVFFRTQDGSNIFIHPAVTENIGINLDAYKNKVRAFSIKIADSVFKEIGRTSSSIIFKIIGPNLELENGSTGLYYILDDNSELVTTGKYMTVI